MCRKGAAIYSPDLTAGKVYRYFLCFPTVRQVTECAVLYKINARRIRDNSADERCLVLPDKLALAGPEPVQSIAGCYPQGAVFVQVKIANFNVTDTGSVYLGIPRETLFFGIEEIQALLGSDPEIAVRIFQYPIDFVVADAIVVVRIMLVMPDLIPVVPVQSGIGADPQESLAILVQVGHL